MPSPNRGRLHPARAPHERYQLLSEAVAAPSKALPNTKVYLDAGNPDWIDEPAKMAQPLREAGVERADGFSLNVSNFQSNDSVKTYAEQLSDAVGGSHFVIDTSRNGNGPLSGGREEAWRISAGLGARHAPDHRHRRRATRRLSVDRAAGRLRRHLPRRPAGRRPVAGVRARPRPARRLLTPVPRLRATISAPSAGRSGPRAYGRR
ncbi:hypothetical protein SCYAM73S_03902 [Streptomyces cyaneofuscatus]